MDQKRHFILDNSPVSSRGGRFSDYTPMLVAKRVAKILLRKNNNNTVSFCLRETTRYSKKTKYNYVANMKSNKIVVKTNNAIHQNKYNGGTAFDYANTPEIYNYSKFLQDVNAAKLTNNGSNTYGMLIFQDSIGRNMGELIINDDVYSIINSNTSVYNLLEALKQRGYVGPYIAKIWFSKTIS